MKRLLKLALLIASTLLLLALKEGGYSVIVFDFHFSDDISVSAASGLMENVRRILDEEGNLSILPFEEMVSVDIPRNTVGDDQHNIDFQSAQLVNIPLAVTGEVSRNGNNLRISATLWDIGRERPLWISCREFEEGNPSSISQAIKNIAQEFSSAAEEVIAREPPSPVKRKTVIAEDFPYFGVRLKELDPSTASFLEVPPGAFGVVVKKVDKGSPAWHGGVRAWDIISEMERQPIQVIPDFRDILKIFQPHRMVEFKIIRNSMEYTFRVKLAPPEERRGPEWY